MIETEITIMLNRKSDFNLIEKVVLEQKIRYPVFIREYESKYQINLKSDYEEWELDSAILECFPEYEYTTEVNKERKEIRIQIFRYQSEYSTDGWGRQIENPLCETKYLVKKSSKQSETFSPRIKVLFESKERYYYINIVDGINKANNEKGFLLLDNFTSNNDDNRGQILKDKLYKSSLEAFNSGCSKLSELVYSDFDSYLKNKKKTARSLEKAPRKTIRDFINACNSGDEMAVFKNVAENIVFERRINRQTIIKTRGIDEFKDYLNSPNQTLYGKGYKIRSSWNFNIPTVTIGVKYFPRSEDSQLNITQKYGQIKFLLEDIKIVHIIDES